MAEVNMESVWGESDCFTWLSVQGGQRPKWLAEAKDEMQAGKLAIKRHRSLHNAYKYFAKKQGMKQVKGGLNKVRPGDRVFGRDLYSGVIGAVVQDDYTHVVRATYGYRTAQWRQVYSIWRPKEE